MTTILLVEDALDLAGVVRRELEAEGYQVQHAADGLAALQLLDPHAPQPTGVLPQRTGVLPQPTGVLPRLDGLEVLRRLRASSAVPVLMLTARGEETDRVVGLELGADDYLTKPFSMRELVARIHALLRRIQHVQEVLAADRSAAPAPLQYGPLRLDPAQYRATLDGAPLDLTRTEFDLLQLLLRNPGRAFSRTYLLDTVWGADYVTGDRSVDNAILRLRKKLGPLEKAVETVWGVGYRLRPDPPASPEALDHP
jgi:DNA-binding response OmpR family regulator